MNWYDHLYAGAGAIAAIAAGFIDLHTGMKLSQPIDIALVIAGFGVLGIKPVIAATTGTSTGTTTTTPTPGATTTPPPGVA